MANENALYFLSEESLEALEGSKGAIILIQFPRDIEELRSWIAELQGMRIADARKLEALQKEFEKVCKPSLRDRIFNGKQIKQQKSEYAQKIGDLAQTIASYDSKIGQYSSQMRTLSDEYNKFVRALLNVNLSPEEVVAEYHRIKEMLERKARGEYVEEVSSVPVHEDEIPAQNLKANPRLSQREKFERRMAIAAQKSAKTGKQTNTQKQPGQD